MSHWHLAFQGARDQPGDVFCVVRGGTHYLVVPAAEHICPVAVESGYDVESCTQCCCQVLGLPSGLPGCFAAVTPTTMAPLMSFVLLCVLGGE